MNNIQKAISNLKDDATCVLTNNNNIYIRKEKGITPLISLINEKVDLNGYSLADKIVGKAVALLSVYAGIVDIYGEVMSSSAIEVLKQHNINYSYKTLTDKIINRSKTDICPMEKTVLNIDDSKLAYEALNNKIKELSI